MTSTGGRPSFPEVQDQLALVNELGDLLPDGLVVVGADRVVRFVNAEALRILDAERANLVGRPLAEALPFVDKHGRDWWARADPWVGLRSRTGHRERLLVARGGRDVLVTARYVRSARGGAIERVMLGLRDAEARLRAERDQANVLSTVAHELRAPLTSVAGFTSSLLRRWDRFTDAQKRLMIETIESDANRLTRLIGELLDISRIDSDRLRLNLGPVDVDELIRAHVVRHELGRPGGVVRMRMGERAQRHGMPDLWADRDRLEQVVFNLVDNALQHGSGPVDVTLDRGADGSEEVVLIVDDHGDGIAVEDRDRVFERFWHGPSNASTGLGLYVVRGLVEAHGGTVRAAANDAGGARLVVRLPAGMPDLVTQ